MRYHLQSKPNTNTKTSESECKRCLILRKEVERLGNELQALKLSNYWAFNGVEYLEIEMRGVNDALPQLQCKCSRCGPRKPNSASLPSSNEDTCRFRPWFLTLLDEVGLQYCVNEGLNTEKEESEVHLVLPSMRNDGLVTLNVSRAANAAGKMRYGGKMKNARLGSAELKLLDRLFEVLAEKQEA